jgi:hypothetical protein
MRRLLIVFILLVAGVVGLGFYMGWFHVSLDRTDGKTHITGTVDEEKIKEDKEKAKEKVQELEQKAREKASAATDTNKDAASPP